MKNRAKKGAARWKAFAAARPNETRWSILGAAAGFAVGLLVGGIGIAAMGGAVGIPAALIFAGIGGAIGNRYGISRDRPVSQ